MCRQTHLALAVALLVAVLFPAGLQAEQPNTLRGQIDAVMRAQPAVAASLPAHPMAPALLAACVDAVTKATQTDEPAALEALCMNAGDSPVAIMALDSLLLRRSPADAEALCVRICKAEPNAPVASRALDYLLGTGPESASLSLAWIEYSGETRLGAYAHARRAWIYRLVEPWDSAAHLLNAWAIAPEPLAARYAAEARELLAMHGQSTDLALLGAPRLLLPVPRGLLRRRAEVLRRVTNDLQQTSQWLERKEAWSPPREIHAADRAVGLYLQARVAQANAKGQLPALRSAETEREAALAAFESAQGDLPADEQAYFILLLADACAQDFQSPRARALLNALPTGDSISSAYQDAATALRARLAEESNTPQGTR